MSSLRTTERVLWNALNDDPYDPATVLILADYLEEQGGSERLQDGLRALVAAGRIPFQSRRYPRCYAWGLACIPEFDEHRDSALPEELFALLNDWDSRRVSAVWRWYPSRAAAIRAYAAAWLALYS